MEPTDKPSKQTKMSNNQSVKEGPQSTSSDLSPSDENLPRVNPQTAEGHTLNQGPDIFTQVINVSNRL